MHEVGFIGYGSMGRMLVDGLLSSSAVAPSDMIIATRTPAKLDSLAWRWPGIAVTGDNRLAACETRILFICVKPLDTLPVLLDLITIVSLETHIVSIAACVTISDLERVFGGKITKVIPSITSEVHEGVSLVCHNSKVHSGDAARVEALLRSISQIEKIPESDFEVATDLTSCAPGMIAAMFENFVGAALRHGDLPLEVARRMVVSTLLGTAKLLAERNMGFSELIDRVATKGGITEEGVKVLNRHLPVVFDEVFEKTLAKHETVKEMVKNQKVAQVAKC
jgi:pyrroline-5-carboxylate reductase